METLLSIVIEILDILASFRHFAIWRSKFAIDVRLIISAVGSIFNLLRKEYDPKAKLVV